jgi:hypothetical protein
MTSPQREKNEGTYSTRESSQKHKQTQTRELANGNLLAKCMHGRTQNSNGSLKNWILNPALKVSF